MRRHFAHGTSRLVLCIGALAFKLSDTLKVRNATGLKRKYIGGDP